MKKYSVHKITNAEFAKVGHVTGAWDRFERFNECRVFDFDPFPPKLIRVEHGVALTEHGAATFLPKRRVAHGLVLQS